MLRAFQYRWYPSRLREQLLAQTPETSRHWYNTILPERLTAWPELHENISQYAPFRQAKKLKAANPFAAAVHPHGLQQVVHELDKVFQAFFRRGKAGETPGCPWVNSRNRFPIGKVPSCLPNLMTMLFKHGDRLAHIDIELVIGVEARGRQLVINNTESKDDLIQDMADGLTSLSARSYGQRGAANRAKRALKAIEKIE